MVNQLSSAHVAELSQTIENRETHNILRASHANRLDRSTKGCDSHVHNPQGSSSQERILVLGLYPKYSFDAHTNKKCIQLEENGKLFPVQNFPFVGSAFTGIIDWMGRQYGETDEWRNPTLSLSPGVEPLMQITRSSCAKGRPEDAVSKRFVKSCTKSDPVIDDTESRSNWYLFDFKSLRILPTHYTIRHGWKRGKFCLRDWIFEGSSDGVTWTVIKQHDNDRTLEMSPTNSKVWALGYAQSTERPKCFKYLRVRIIAPNSHGSYTLSMSGFEVFGGVVDAKQPLVT